MVFSVFLISSKYYHQAWLGGLRLLVEAPNRLMRATVKNGSIVRMCNKMALIGKSFANTGYAVMQYQAHCYGVSSLPMIAEPGIVHAWCSRWCAGMPHLYRREMTWLASFADVAIQVQFSRGTQCWWISIARHRIRARERSSCNVDAPTGVQHVLS